MPPRVVHLPHLKLTHVNPATAPASSVKDEPEPEFTSKDDLLSSLWVSEIPGPLEELQRALDIPEGFDIEFTPNDELEFRSPRVGSTETSSRRNETRERIRPPIIRVASTASSEPRREIASIDLTTARSHATEVVRTERPKTPMERAVEYTARSTIFRRLLQDD